MKKNVKRRLDEPAFDHDTTLSIVAKLVAAFSRTIPMQRDIGLRDEALRLGRELLRGTKYEEM